MSYFGGWVDGVYWSRKLLLNAADGTKCAYCGCTMWRRRNQCSPQAATIDHVIPVSRDFMRDHMSKDLPAFHIVCYACNQDKAALTLNEYRAALSVRYRKIYLFWFERQHLWNLWFTGVTKILSYSTFVR